MKKRIKEFLQHLYHDIEDDAKAEEYLEESLPLVGSVVMYFNALEKSLDSTLCEIFSDRTDAVGLIVLNKLNYSAKVDLFKRFADDFHRCIGKEPDRYKSLIASLTEVGQLRNLVVHADWENTDPDGYTYVRLKISAQGMNQEYVQFSSESLIKLIDKIAAVRGELDSYWEERCEILTS